MTVLSVDVSMAMESQCQHVFGKEVELADKAEIDRARPGVAFASMYFSYFHLLADGTLTNLIKELPTYQKMGVKHLWISPVHPQTVTQYPPPGPGVSTTVNNHRYWPLDHASVDPNIGGEVEFRRLVKEARALGIEIVLDVVMDHFGYAETVPMYFRSEDGVSFRQEMVSTRDPRYFRTGQFDEAMLKRLYDELENVSDGRRNIEILELLGVTRWDREMPILNHNNPVVRDHMLYSYQKFVDMGVRNFRLDAIKHMPLSFTIQFLRDIADYAKSKYGQRLNFVAEHFVCKDDYIALREMVEIFATEVPQASVYFFDFPFAWKIRALANGWGFGFDHFAGHMGYRQDPSNRVPENLLVTPLFDHDFLTNIQDRFLKLMLHGLAGFFSVNGPMLFHGMESSDRVDDARSLVRETRADGDVGQIVRVIEEALGPYKAEVEFRKTEFSVASHNQLVAVKKFGKKIFVFAVNRAEGPWARTIRFDMPINFIESTVRRVASSNDGIVHANLSQQGDLELRLDGQAFAVWEITQR